MKKIISLLVLTILCFSCVQDDDFIENIIIDDPSQTISDIEFVQNNFGSLVNSSFIGVVVNENNEKLQGVETTINNEVVYTDSNGVFIFNNVSVYEKFAFIKVKKAGYITGSRSIVPVSNGTNDIQITLLEKNITGTVSSGEISEVSLSNGAKVEFSGDFIDVEGNPYSGNVDVSLHYLEPNTEATFTKMPGMLFGKRNNGSASAMETYGMLAVDLYSQTGEELNISETSTAILTFPVSASTPNAPDTIVLWYFDDVNGYWKEQGMATKNGNEYVAEVNHFTWWNCDFPLDTVNVCFTLTATNNLSNFYFDIIRNQTNQMIFSGYTNDEGEACGLFPANEEMTINIYSVCTNTVIYSQTIGSYASDTNIAYNIPSLPSEIIETTLTATLITCSGVAVNNGYAIISNTSNINSELISIENGVINHPFVYCDGVSYSVVVYDADSQENSGVINISLNPSTINLGNILTCGNETVLIGDLVAGGVVFYIAPTPTDLDGNGTLDTGLVCSLSDYTSEVEWGCVLLDLPSVPNVASNNGNPVGLGAEIGDGMSNTNAILNDCPDAPAALAARSLGVDWFLPSIRELNEIYLNKTTIELVPGVSLFTQTGFWSSSERNSGVAWLRPFDGGGNYLYTKDSAFNVRAVRAF